MSAEVLHEIALFISFKEDVALIDRLQLIVDDDALIIHGEDGNEPSCDENEIAAVIAAVPALQ